MSKLQCYFRRGEEAATLELIDGPSDAECEWLVGWSLLWVQPQEAQRESFKLYGSARLTRLPPLIPPFSPFCFHLDACPPFFFSSIIAESSEAEGQMILDTGTNSNH
jgi:hypothetical protein